MPLASPKVRSRSRSHQVVQQGGRRQKAAADVHLSGVIAAARPPERKDRLVIEDWGQIKRPRLVAQKMLQGFADLPVVDCGPIANGRGSLRAIFGMTTTESSFKSIHGF